MTKCGLQLKSALLRGRSCLVRQAHAATALQSARAEAGLASRDNMESTGGAGEDNEHRYSAGDLRQFASGSNS